MQWNVEIPLESRMIERLGKDQAVAELTFRAWYIALKDGRPTRSLTLQTTEIRLDESFGLPLRRYRFIFEVE